MGQLLPGPMMEGEPRSHLRPTSQPVITLLPACVACSFFCPASTSSVVGNECPAGHYCPASTSFASQFPCPRGTYRPQRGSARQSDCTPCEPGKGTYPHPSRVRPHPPRPGTAGLSPVSDGRAVRTAHSAHEARPHSLAGVEGAPIPLPPKPEDPVFPSLLQAPTASYLGWQPCPGLVAQGSTVFRQQLFRIPLMASQETSVLQATFVPRVAPSLLHAPQVSYRWGAVGNQQCTGLLQTLEGEGTEVQPSGDILGKTQKKPPNYTQKAMSILHAHCMRLGGRLMKEVMKGLDPGSLGAA